MNCGNSFFTCFFNSGKVRLHKMLASKGVDTEKIWKDVATGLDNIDAISKGLNEKLMLNDVQGN